MLRIVKSLAELKFDALMAVYREGNLENARERYPNLPEGYGLLRAEQDFYQYLRESFFVSREAVYGIWIENGTYVSALRLEPYWDGLLLEALETEPGQRGKGYARSLILAATEAFSEYRIYSHVSKKNLPSLRVHEVCGFQRIAEYAAYIDGSVNYRACTLLLEKR